MFTNNYWKMRAYGENTVPNSNNYALISIGVKNKSGSEFSNYVVSGNTSYPFYSTVWNYSKGTRLIVGTGDTAATVDDVDLEASAMSSLSNVSQTYICGADDNKLQAVFSLSATNSTGADIIIKEIGLETDVSDSNYNKVAILTAREVLSNPITIPAGGSKVITITVITA